MRFSARSKVGIILSLVTILTLVSGFLVMVVSSRNGASAHQSGGLPTAHFVSKKHVGTLIATHRSHATVKHHAVGSQKPKAFAFRSPGKKSQTSHVSSHTAVGGVSSTGIYKGHVAEGTLLANFNGLSDLDSAILNGFEDTPPDQGLCVGNDPSLAGDPKVVFEMVNSAVRETDTTGTLVFPDLTFGQFWGDPNAFSDPRCIYDKPTATFFFSIISFDANGTTVDVAVLNANQFATYSFSTSFGGAEFGDQPKLGVDNRAVYITTDEFGAVTYDGAFLFGISKSQIESGLVPNPLAAGFFPLVLGGIPILSPEPAISTSSTNKEYAVNAFPFDAFGNVNTAENFLGFWTVHHDDAITTGNFLDVTLDAKVIRSETYGFPVPAASTGDGSVDVNGITSEAFLNPDDDRMQACQYIDNNVWCSLDTAVSISHDPNTRDGAAWFKIDSVAGRVIGQGYLASTGSYLLYPAIVHTHEGSTTLSFTITNPGLDPSAAYSERNSDTHAFGSIVITALGVTPHQSFAEVLFGQRRWGDYSWATLDTNGKDMWLATEWIPGLTDQDPEDNWGTNVWEVAGDH
jgi:hypothetical protein